MTPPDPAILVGPVKLTWRGFVTQRELYAGDIYLGRVEGPCGTASVWYVRTNGAPSPLTSIDNDHRYPTESAARSALVAAARKALHKKNEMTGIRPPEEHAYTRFHWLVLSGDHYVVCQWSQDYWLMPDSHHHFSPKELADYGWAYWKPCDPHAAPSPLSARLAEALRVTASYLTITHDFRYQPINREKLYADGKLVREALAEYDAAAKEDRP